MLVSLRPGGDEGTTDEEELTHDELGYSFFEPFATKRRGSRSTESPEAKQRKSQRANDFLSIVSPDEVLSRPIETPVNVPGGCQLDCSTSKARIYLDYKNVRQIGTGSFGSVFEVTCRLTEQKFALKKTSKPYRGGNERAKLLREITALSQVALSNKVGASRIVLFFDAWFEDDHMYLVTELCECSLENQLLRRLPFASVDVISMLGDMCLALETLHSMGFAHLDVKPGNILFKNGQYKLADFGMVCRIGGSPSERDDVEEGDSRYMANELLQWEPVEDPTKCDVFSLGITCYEVVSGRTLTINGPFWQALRDGSETLLGASNYPSGLLTLVAEMMAPLPKCRPSAASLLSRPLLSRQLDADSFREDGTQQLSAMASPHAVAPETTNTAEKPMGNDKIVDAVLQFAAAVASPTKKQSSRRSSNTSLRLKKLHHVSPAKSKHVANNKAISHDSSGRSARRRTMSF